MKNIISLFALMAVIIGLSCTAASRPAPAEWSWVHGKYIEPEQPGDWE